MVARVKIQGGIGAAIQVSLPGYDVNSATLDQMAFDGRFANMELIMAGFVSVPYQTWVTVYFPTAYAIVPRVFMGLGGSWAQAASTITQIQNPSAILTSNQGTFKNVRLAQVGTSYVQFYSAYGPEVEYDSFRHFAGCTAFYAVYR